jgi:Ca2+-binding EF-hand superfamily protein
MLTKLKLALALSGSLFAGAAGIASAHGPGKGELLQKYDTNHDGKLDDQEKAAMRADFEAKRAQKKAELLQKYDLNKDGKLDDNERAVMRDDRTVEAFKKMDLDGNGSISLDELKAARAKMWKTGMGHARHFHKGMRKGLGGSKL